MRIRGTRLAALAVGASVLAMTPTAAHAKEACVWYDFDGVVNDDDRKCYDVLPNGWNVNHDPDHCEEPLGQRWCVGADFWLTL